MSGPCAASRAPQHDEDGRRASRLNTCFTELGFRHVVRQKNAFILKILRNEFDISNSEFAACMEP